MADNKKDTPQDFQPRDRGEVADALDEGARQVSRRLASDDDTVSTDPIKQTSWEDRVERGEEWTEEQVPEREARGDEEPNSEVSRRGLVNPPPEE